MADNDNAMQSILDGVNILVDKKFKKSPILENGVITKIDSNGYSVKVNNIEYSNVKTIGGTCSINETVKVGVPYGNYSRMFIIKGGTSGASGVTSVNGKTGEVVLSAGDIGAQPSGNYATISQLSTETSNRIDSDTTLQTQINTLQSKSDVVDIVGTYTELQSYDTSKLGNNDIIKVLEDSTHNNNATYYRWSTTTNIFTYIGQEIDVGTIVTVGGVNQDTWNADIKANLDSPTFTGTVNGITKAMVGLGNVDNTSDVSKPISTATQTALNTKINIDTANNKYVYKTSQGRIEGANLDLNDYTVGGFWNVKYGVKNYPLYHDGALLILPWNTGKWVKQIVTGTGANTKDIMYMRHSNSIDATSWTDWVQVYDSQNPQENITGNAGSATKSTQDANGNIITSTYGASLKISGQTVSLVSKSGATLSSVTVPTGVIEWQ